jgi:hypothetical protein
MKISYAITVCNELEEIMRLLDLLLKNKQKQDEIVVLIDTVKANEQLISTLRHYEMHNMDHMVVWPGEFEGHFANWKNKLTSYCSGDYIFQIDADEMVSETLIQNLPDILKYNLNNEVYLVARINTVDGLTEEHINKWKWNVNENNWINFPDYQWRIYKNDSKIVWINKVHECLSGFNTYANLPPSLEYCLLHHKTIEKQEKQNNYYSTL